MTCTVAALAVCGKCSAVREREEREGGEGGGCQCKCKRVITINILCQLPPSPPPSSPSTDFIYKIFYLVHDSDLKMGRGDVHKTLGIYKVVGGLQDLMSRVRSAMHCRIQEICLCRFLVSHVSKQVDQFNNASLSGWLSDCSLVSLV